jgi:organic hydroperoxide reductase OsmC/OhrA
MVSYVDRGEATLGLTGGRMAVTMVTLRPEIALGSRTDPERAVALVAKAHEQCFVANAVSARVEVEPRFTVR